MTSAEELLKAAIRKMLADEATARRLGQVLTTVQKGKERLEGTRERLLEAVGIAGRAEWRRLSRRLAGTRRRVRELDARVARAEAARTKRAGDLSNSVVDR
jgi:hypothetical protein